MTAQADSPLADELLSARAAEAARAGDLDEAHRLLREAVPTTPALLDLLARVHAQRGELAEADACWARVAGIDPDGPAAGAAATGRRAVAHIQAGQRRGRPLLDPRWVAVAAAVTACAVLIGAGVWVSSLRATPQRVRAVAALPGTGPAPVPTGPPQPSPVVAALSRQLTLPGLHVTARPDGVQVIFDHGLFVRSDNLTPDGAALLALLGRRMAGRNLAVTVIGHAVAVRGGRTSGGSVVALARAVVAAQVLADNSGKPLTAFALRSADQADGPFPDAARNRTVTLLVTP